MIGFDIGTYNLICSRRGNKDEIRNRREVNAFIEIPLDNPFTYNMMERAKVPLIKRDKVAYVFGEAAVNFAYTLNLALKRPMKDGCLNPAEKNAFNILQLMIHSMVGEIEKDGEVLFYSVPANAVNFKTDADYHQKVIDDIFKSYHYKDKKLRAYPINEALALIFAELADKNYTGIGISFGSGMVNFCYAIFTQPAIMASSVNSGDWIDEQAARAIGESPTVINKEKTKIDLRRTPTSLVERAIQSQYRILLEKTITTFKKSLLEGGKKIRAENPVDVIIGGGTASPPGFEEMFAEILKSSDFPLPIGEITKPTDHLFTVARGALVAAEAAQN